MAALAPPAPGAPIAALDAYRAALLPNYNAGINHVTANPNPADLAGCRASLDHMGNMFLFLNAERRHSNRVINDQDALLVALQAQVAALPAPAAAAPVHRVKVPLPKTFSGVQSEARPFMQTLLLYILQHQAEFPDDAARIRFALALLEGRALTWASRIQDALLNPPAAPALAIPEARVWADFQAAFQQTFYDPDEQRSARSKMAHLKQDRSVAEYTADWNHQAQLLNYEDSAPIRASYYSGLKPRVQQEIIMRGEPDTLQDLIALATRIDAAQFAAYKASPSHTKPGASSSGGRTSTNTKLYSMPGVNQTLPPGTKVKTEPINFTKGHVNPVERKRRIDNNLCLYCGQAGHMRFNCPNRPTSTNNIEEEVAPPNPYGLAYAEDF
jgi:hypothetical protein